MGQYKGEEIMKKVGYVLIIIALSTMSFLLIKKIEIKEEEKNNVEEYLDITSTTKSPISSPNILSHAISK